MEERKVTDSSSIQNLEGYKNFENFEEFIELIRNKELQFNLTNKRNIRDNHRLILRNNSEMRVFTEYLRREQNNCMLYNARLAGIVQ